MCRSALPYRLCTPTIKEKYHETRFFLLQTFIFDKDESPTQIRHPYVLEIDRMRVDQLK